MSDNITRTEAKDVAQQAADQPAVRQSTEFLIPTVDVFEDDTGITLIADLPGVSGERLNIRVDRDTLVFEGEAALDMPKDMQALYAEIRNPRYRRSFALSSELDTQAIEANLKDGVLTLRLPKKAIYQPRKIQVQTA
jgi:HSP20 family molecular chaperone IbpA